jgi:polysaccharide biosynthesis protein PelC
MDRLGRRGWGRGGRRGLWLLALLAATLAGCAPAVESYLHPDVDLGHVRRVAVLPFANLSSDEVADERLYSLFMTRLLGAQVVEIVEAGAVREALVALRLTPESTPTPEQIVALGAALGVDAVFAGTVEEYGTQRGNRETLSQVTASFTLTETQRGLLVWRAQAHASSASFWRRLFGTSERSLHEISAAAIDRALETLF